MSACHERQEALHLQGNRLRPEWLPGAHQRSQARLGTFVLVLNSHLMTRRKREIVLTLQPLEAVRVKPAAVAAAIPMADLPNGYRLTKWGNSKIAISGALKGNWQHHSGETSHDEYWRTVCPTALISSPND